MLKNFFPYKKNDSLVRDSFTLFIATMIANATAYVYHFYMGRVLGPEDYGILGVILSLFYIINVPLNVIQMTITKFTAHFHVIKEKERIWALYSRGLRKLFFSGVITFLVFLVLSIPLSRFLHIPIQELLVFSPIMILALILPVTRGVLQGLQSFKKLGYNMICEGFSKLILGVTLVFLGFHVSGAIAGIVLSFFIAFILSRITLKKLLPPSSPSALDTTAIYRYATPVFISLLALTLYYSIDVLLIKHYFDELQAGYYVAASIIGKIIFFGTFSLGLVMFPKVAEMHTMQKENKHLLSKSLILMTAGAAVLLLCYFFLPRLIILPLFGNNYLPVISLIGPFGVFMTFFSFNYLLSLYNLSIQHTSFIRILVLFNILEILLLVFYHTSLEQVIWTLSCLMIALFILLFLYTYRKKYAATHTLNHYTRV